MGAVPFVRESSEVLEACVTSASLELGHVVTWERAPETHSTQLSILQCGLQCGEAKYNAD